MHYEAICLQSDTPTLIFTLAEEEAMGMKITACIGEQPPAEVCTHLLFLLYFLSSAWLQQTVCGGTSSAQFTFFLILWGFESLGL